MELQFYLMYYVIKDKSFMYFTLVVVTVITALACTYWYKRKQKKPRRIIFLSLALCNGSIILQYFGQNRNIMAKTHGMSRLINYGDALQQSDKKKLDELNLEAYEAMLDGYTTFIAYKMANEVTLAHLDYLIKLGFEIVVNITNPKRQYVSMLRLKNVGVDKMSRLDTMNVGWTNLLHYVNCIPIVGIINSNKFCNDVTYRMSVCNRLSINHKPMFENLMNSSEIMLMTDCHKQKINSDQINDQEERDAFNVALNAYNKILRSDKLIGSYRASQ